MVIEELPDVQPDPWRVTWNLGTHALRDLADYAAVDDYAAGTTIFSSGDESNAMYLVLEGEIEVLREDDNGQQHSASIIGEGQSFGEVGLLINQQRLATTIARIDSRLLKVTYDDLVRLEVEKPEFMIKLYKRLAQTLAEQWMLSASRPHDE